ncbi:MAG: NAD(P)-dependent oxidoreductase [Deltaproteobacteria bacterium]|nr:NAD(P)-dependent oxidoreductase [Deltaproteobacteria bacterium]
MTTDLLKKHAIGWIGCGRMGYSMAERLAKAGCDISVYNRTKAKAEPLAEFGAKIVDKPADLAGCDVVFCMVSEAKDLKQVLLGEGGLISKPGKFPKIVVDSTTISVDASAEIREALGKANINFIAAPVSGNAKVVKAGKLSIVASGPKAAFDEVSPYINVFGPAGVSYVGEGELARIAKICHNVMLGVVIQNLAEITILAEKAGLPRSAFLSFMNSSVMGSVFSRYKTPALVNLDWTTTFTPYLLRKDLDLGLEMGRKLEVPMPVTSTTRDVLQTHMGFGAALGSDYLEKDFSTLLEHEARSSGMKLKSENVEVWDGLSPQKK